MAEASLVDRDMKAGESLVRAVMKKIDIRAAFWLLSDGGWRLHLAADVAKLGYRGVLKVVQDATKPGRSYKIPLEQVVVHPADALMVKLIGTMISTGGTIQGIRMTNTVIDGAFFPDIYIYVS